MAYIIIFLLISQDKVSGPSPNIYDFNDFANPIIASGNMEYTCWNPAAVSNKKTFSFGSSFVYTSGTLDLGSDFNFKTSEILPEFLGIAFPLNEKISLGFSFSIPYKYSRTSSWTPIFIPPTEDSIKFGSVLRIYAFNPIVSYIIKENLTIGINTGILLKKYNEYAEYNSPDSSKREINGTYYGAEPNLGIQYQLNEKSRIDLSIKKGFLQGTETWPDEEYSIKEILPLIGTLGIQTNMTPELTLNSAVEFIHWQGIGFYLDGEKEELSGGIRNVFRIYHGFEYKIKSKYALNLGVYNDAYLTRIPFLKKEQLFLIGGIGAEFGRLKINFTASSSSLTKTGDEETNNFHLSIAY